MGPHYEAVQTRERRSSKTPGKRYEDERRTNRRKKYVALELHSSLLQYRRQ